jgi:ATP-binding cassette subfamily C (CFTR/MRP) protein 1
MTYFSKMIVELERINRETKVDVYQHINETISGCAVIKAFGKANMFEDIHESNAQSQIKRDTFRRELHCWLECYAKLGLNMILIAAIFAMMFMRGSIAPAFAGMALHHIMGIPDTFIHLGYSLNNAGGAMRPFRRALKMAAITPEAPRTQKCDDELYTWNWP